MGSSTPDRERRLHRFETSARMPGTREEVWCVVTDHELYGRIAPNLSRVGATAPNGPRLTRRGWDRSGRHWDEACTLWEDGRAFAVEVDTSAEDYPYPLDVMRGEWSVEPEGPEASRVRVRFEFRGRAGLAGRAFTTTMRAAMGPTVSRITRGWRRELERRQSARLRERAV